IWRRQAASASDPVRRLHYRIQAARMFRIEREMCRRAGHVIAVSRSDADAIRSLFAVTRVTAVPTGVDVEYFTPPRPVAFISDLIFVGSMDWKPNIDGVTWFVAEILPLIRRRRPECSLAIVGRKPT